MDYIYFHICALWHVGNCLSVGAKRTVVYGVVTSWLDYCNLLLFGTKLSNLKKLQRVRNSLARTVLKSSWKSSSAPMLTKQHWLPIPSRIAYKIALLTFKTRADHELLNIYELLKDYSSSGCLISVSESLLIKPVFPSSAAMSSFSYAAPSVWNNLNVSTRQASSTESF